MISIFNFMSNSDFESASENIIPNFFETFKDQSAYPAPRHLGKMHYLYPS